MRMRMLQMLACGLLVMSQAVCAVGAAEDQKAFEIPRMEEVVVDGELGDWGDEGFLVGVLASEKREFKAVEDFDGRFRLGWNEAGLLVAIEVRDDEFVEHPDEGLLWSRDAIELFMATEPGSLDRYQPVISPGMAEGQPQARYKLYDFRTSPELKEEALTLKLERARTEDGYVLEVLMPWSNLAIEAGLGAEIGFQIYLNDCDDPDLPLAERFTGTWFPASGSQYDTTKMYRLRLSETASPSVRALANLKYFTSVSLAWCEVIGIPELVGERFELRVPGIEPVSATFVEEAGRAVGRCYVDTGEPPAEDVRCEVMLGDEAVSNMAYYTAPCPQVEFEVGATAEGVSVTPRLSPAGALPDRKPVKGALYNAAGERTATFSSLVGEAVTVGAGDGYWMVNGEFPDIYGATLTGLRGFAVNQATDAAAMEKWVGASLEDTSADARNRYAGWLKYRLDAMGDEKAEARREELAGEAIGWAIQAKVDTDHLMKRVGRFEWAYESAVDETGQPFTLVVPAGYTPERAWPLMVHLHGAGHTHESEESHAGAFVLSVLGRAPAEGYNALSEVDVEEAMAYVRQNWNIDPDRIHLYGFSMGGGGTFEVATRYPDRFASARPMGSYAGGLPVENMINLPTFLVHSEDDWLCVFGTVMSAVKALSEAGGEVVVETGIGYGHGADPEDFVLSQAWADQQVRHDTPRRVRYTALDGKATGAYWAWVREWGPEFQPAEIDVTIGRDNNVYATFENTAVVEIDLGAAPVDPEQAASIYIDHRLVQTLEAPLPEKIFAVHGDEGWQVSEKEPQWPEGRLHFPGGAKALYQGEPLLVVWGTQGDEATDEAIYEIAQYARRYPDIGWPEEEENANHLMLYGQLAGKPDTEVTESDMQRYNLYLVGTAEENSVVARLADKLPVRVEKGVVRANDGVSWSFEDRALMLTYPNPLAPERLVLWVAGEKPAFYAKGAHLMKDLEWAQALADFRLGAIEAPVTVANRCFDSRWAWPAGYAESPRLEDSFSSASVVYEYLVDSLLEYSGADALVETPFDAEHMGGFAGGESRLSDLQAHWYYDRFVEATLSGAVLEEAQRRIKAQKEEDLEWYDRIAIVTAAPEAVFAARQEYRVVGTYWALSSLCGLMETNFEIRLLDYGRSAVDSLLGGRMTPSAGDVPAPPVMRMGLLGHPLGTYLRIEAARAEEGKVGAKTLAVGRVNGETLKPPVPVWIDNVEALDPGVRYVLHGYESGGMIGVPAEAAEKENLDVPQAAWQFRRHFVVTSVVAPEGLEFAARHSNAAEE